MSAQQIPVMVELSLPAQWPQELIDIIPMQRKITNELLAKGVLQSYSVSASRTRVWFVFVVDRYPEAVEEIMETFPILPFGSYDWERLLLTNDSSSVMHYSLN